MKSLNIVAIGLGKQSTEDHLPAIRESSMFNLLAVTDSDNAKVKIVSKEYSVPGYSNIDDLIERWGERTDVAIIAVPHTQYLSII